MATDVRLDQGDGSFLVLEGRVVKAEASDFMLDAAARRQGGGPHRRALVHDQGDGLTINFNGDYPGGVTLAGVAQITPRRTPGSASDLVPVLVVRGGLSYEARSVDIHGKQGTMTVFLEGELNKLAARIHALEADVVALKARLGV